MTCLNPVLTIGDQISEAVLIHNPGTADGDAMKRAVELLDLVGVPYPERRVEQYPHEFSGGMRQRAMIAMAIANDPSVLDRGRADDSARRHDPGADRRGAQDCAAGDARGDRPHHARSRSHRRARGPSRRHVRRASRRVGRCLHDLQLAGHPYTIGLMNSLARLDTDQERLEPSRPAAEHGQSTARLRLPPALRALTGARSVQDGHSGAADIRRGRRAPLRLPLLR